MSQFPSDEAGTAISPPLAPGLLSNRPVPEAERTSSGVTDRTQSPPRRPQPVADPAGATVRVPSGRTVRPRGVTGGPPTVPGYDVREELSRGGMGLVYLARDLALGRTAAIKVLRPEAAADPAAVRGFVAEARITARLPHPGVPPVYGLGHLPDGRPFLAMKLVGGRTLGAILAARWHRPPSLSADELELTVPDSPGLLDVFEQVCQAVGFAHSQGVVHRDLKPQNVMVGAFGEVQVMDWGLAKDTRDADDPGDLGTTQVDGLAMGTPAYMPPEQARGEWDRVDARADVFALGGILCAVLTGHPPYTGKVVAEVIRRAKAADLTEAFGRLDRCEAAPELIALAKACLAADPMKRPADAGVVTGTLIAYRTSLAERSREYARLQAAAVARSGEAKKYARVTEQWCVLRTTVAFLALACGALAAGLLIAVAKG